MSGRYFAPLGGLPRQDEPLPTRAKFTQSYAYIPRGVMTDIVTSQLPGWKHSRAWILARPLSGFAETFAQYIVEMSEDGGSDKGEPDPEGQAFLFVLQGQMRLRFDGKTHVLDEGGYAYLPPNLDWSVENSAKLTSFVWIRKRYEALDGLSAPQAFVGNENTVDPYFMDPENKAWETKYFMDTSDMAFDMHVNLVGFQPGGVIPFNETHVMEHGIYILEGTAVYRLNQDNHDVKPGDFLWLRAFCPQSCRAFGSNPFRYLLYKDVNRHPKLTLP